MKKVFIGFTSYDGNEWYSIDFVDTDYNNSVQQFRNNLKRNLESGPDDQHLFGLVYVNLKNKDYERLMKVQQGTSLYDGEDYELIEELYNDYGFDSKLVCYDDNSGNIEIVNMYCEDNNLDSDDEDVWEEVSDLLWNEDEQLYSDYLDKYLDKYFKI